MTDNNPIGWVEVAVNDLDRATTFYEKLLGLTLEKLEIDGMEMKMFPYVNEGSGAGTALVKHQDSKPSAEGALVYFTAASGDLQNEQSKVEELGGKVLQEKMAIGKDAEHGYMAIILDTEGNRVALHSMK